jgi:hypothetical protein
LEIHAVAGRNGKARFGREHAGFGNQDQSEAMADILLINRSATITDSDVVIAVAAFNKQVTGDFAPLWGTPGAVFFGQSPADAWRFYLQDGIDQANDLGYHDDGTGVPEAKIDIRGAISSGTDWRTVVSHEILEALADPLCTRMSPDGITIVEVCDPVEETLYTIDGVPVSNFVMPAYFGFDTSTKYDFNDQLAGPAPLLLSGGYIMQNLNGQWVSHFGRKADGSLAWLATRPTGRSAWRARNPP